MFYTSLHSENPAQSVAQLVPITRMAIGEGSHQHAEASPDMETDRQTPSADEGENCIKPHLKPVRSCPGNAQSHELIP